MKKLVTAFLCAMLAVVSAVGFAACGGNKDGVVVVAPDGAPALALAAMMNDGTDIDGHRMDYEIVNATTIQTYVTGANPQADICILPVNAASKLLGQGTTYKMLGTVTHGNLYLMKKQGGTDITLDNLDTLIGKTVGVIQLAAVPGLTLKVILSDNDIGYVEMGNDDTVVADKVNLKAVDATMVLPTDTTCDYFVVPEPAVTTKTTVTAGKLSVAGDLQALYGGDNGYPQAVVVAKTSLIESDEDFIKSFIQKISASASDINSGAITVQDAVDAIGAHLTEGMDATFSAANLNATVIANCAINFVASSACKSEVNAFLSKVIAVSSADAATVSDEFYYI